MEKGMMSWPKLLDDWLILLCTKFAHWFQRLTGRTSFFLAKLGLGMCIGSSFVGILNYWVPIIPYPSSPWKLTFEIFMVVKMLYDGIQCNKSEAELYEGKVRLSAWVLSQRSTITCGWRLFLASGSIVEVVVLLLLRAFGVSWTQVIYAGFIPGLAVFSYFIFVNPLPPGQSKVREWVESLGFSPKTVRVEN